MKKTISFGGLGDTFVAWLKNRERKTDFHLFVSDNQTTPIRVLEYLEHPMFKTSYQYQSQFDPFNYQKQVSGYYDSQGFQKVFYTFVDERQGELQIPNPIQNDSVENPWLEIDVPKFEYDVLIQANPKSTDHRRNWNFDLKLLEEQLKKMRLNVKILEPSKTGIIENIETVQKSRLMISNLGFLSMARLAMKLPLIYTTGNCIKKHYVHDKWDSYGYHSENGDFLEIKKKTMEILLKI